MLLEPSIPTNACSALKNELYESRNKGKDVFAAIMFLITRLVVYCGLIGVVLAIYYEYFYSMLLPTVSQGRLANLVDANAEDTWFGVYRELRRTFFLYDEGNSVSLNTLPHWLLYTVLSMPCGLSSFALAPPLPYVVKNLLFFFFQERTFLQMMLVALSIVSLTKSGYTMRHAKVAMASVFAMIAFAYVSRQEGVPMLPCNPLPYYADDNVLPGVMWPSISGIYTGNRYMPYEFDNTRERGPGVFSGWSNGRPTSIGYLLTVLLGVPVGVYLFAAAYRTVLRMKMPNLKSTFTIPVFAAITLLLWLIATIISVASLQSDTAKPSLTKTVLLIPEGLKNMDVSPSVIVLVILIFYKGGLFQAWFFIGRYISYELASGLELPAAASFFVLRRTMTSMLVLIQTMLYQVAGPGMVSLFVGIFEGLRCLRTCFIRDSFETLYSYMYGKRITTVLTQTETYTSASLGFDVLSGIGELCAVTKVAALMTSGRVKFGGDSTITPTIIWALSALQCFFIAIRTFSVLYMQSRFHGVDVSKVIGSMRKNRLLLFIFAYDAAMSFMDLTPGYSTVFSLTQMCPSVVNATVAGSSGLGEVDLDVSWLPCPANFKGTKPEIERAMSY